MRYLAFITTLFLSLFSAQAREGSFLRIDTVPQVAGYCIIFDEGSVGSLSTLKISRPTLLDSIIGLERGRVTGKSGIWMLIYSPDLNAAPYSLSDLGYPQYTHKGDSTLINFTNTINSTQRWSRQSLAPSNSPIGLQLPPMNARQLLAIQLRPYYILRQLPAGTRSPVFKGANIIVLD